MTAADATDAERLRVGAAELGVPLTSAQQELLLRFVDQIYLWNKTAGLTTIPRSEAVRLHILDSLAAIPFVEHSPCADLGTGAGLPGLVLAISRPSIEVVLIESNRRKCSFLHETIRVLGIANAQVLETDATSLRRRFATVISRAFRPPAEFLRIAKQLVAEGGRVVLLMANPDEAELAALAAGGMTITKCRRLELPQGGEARTIVSLEGP